jgi:hypothetical protein|tara:strand:+ start:348 stop:521 length:174 start_codon:yes stop_codon:yes gene_type:complete
MIKKIFFFLFLASCGSTNSNVNNNNKVHNFNENLSFKKFKEMLIQYAEKSPYPNIDK